MIATRAVDLQQRRIVAVSMLVTASTVLPGFMIGAVSVQVRADFGVTEGTYGWGLGGFFLAATAGSVVLGRLVQRIGPRRQITLALALTILADLGVAIVADSFAAVVGFLALAGLSNAANQTAVNMALSRAQLPRLGLAIAFKQSGMPTAAMLSGLAVPTLALTVGWRWAFAAAAMLAGIALVAVWSVIEPVAAGGDRVRARPATPARALWLAATSGAFLAFCAGALTAWIVESGVDAGLSEGFAGVMLSVGAATGIAARLLFGTRADAMTMRPFTAVAVVLLVGIVGFVLLAARTESTHVVATVVAFVGGWTWPVFSNFGIVRANKNASGAATGITQMGVYIGVFSAPLITGQLIERAGYTTMWLTVAVVAAVGAALARSVAREF